MRHFDLKTIYNLINCWIRRQLLSPAGITLINHTQRNKGSFAFNRLERHTMRTFYRMSYLKALSPNLFLLFVLLHCSSLFAGAVEFDSQKFIDVASVRSISEIETAKIAVHKSASPAVKVYAQAMIVENTLMLNSLRSLAHENHLHMLSDAELQTKAHKYVFERKGQNFDTAYAGMRAVDRRKMVNLFREAINSDDVAFKHYAEATLPTLMHQLYMAQAMVVTVGSTTPSLLASNP